MKRLISFLLAFASIFTLTACEREATHEEFNIEDIPRMGGTLNLQMRAPDTFDPIETESQTARDALLIVYEPLFDITDNFGAEAVLADSFTFSQNATRLTVKLKTGVLWHNGERFGADDVCYTVNKIMESETSSYRENLEKLDSVAKISDSEVVFNLKEPYAQFIYALYFPIVNEGVDLENAIVGTGPYMLNERDAQQMSLKRFEGWHGGSSYIENINILFMRTSAMAQESFASGKIHVVSHDMLDGENFAIKDGMKEEKCPGGVFEFLGFNTKEGIFSDPLLRIAASNAIDREGMESVFGSSYDAGFPLVSGSAAFSPSYETSSYNSEYAREVIFSAGWTDTDSDDKPEKNIDGTVTRLSFDLLVSNSDGARVKAAEEVKKQLEATGFIVNIVELSQEEYEDRVEKGEYDAFLGAVYLNVPYDLSKLFSSDGTLNFFSYNSHDMDEALKNAEKAGKAEELFAALTAVQSIFIAEQPMTGIAFRAVSLVTQSGVGGTIKPYPYSSYANIDKWYLYN